ncbi:MAG: protocatechuate 3,4-dioxygenase subunit beta [Desulfobacteraceae bacterium]
MTFLPRDWDSHPPLIYSEYKSTNLRGPTQPLVPIRQSGCEITGPSFDARRLGPLDHDLTKNARVNGEPLGERIVVTGQVRDENGHPIPHTLIEVWQANAAGRYIHVVDDHPAPLDPNFLGAGRCITDKNGHYRFYTIKPGAYPWKNHYNAWRPNHIHFSLLGPAMATRLVTQMYFPGDPLLDLDPIFQGAPAATRHRLISRFSIEVTEPDFALGYVFDIVLRGRTATPVQR